MSDERSSYEKSGVRSTHASRDPSLSRLTEILRGTFPKAGEPGEPLLDFGYYAGVVRVSDDLALAVTTDGVGTKILVAEAMGKFDTVGIDCVAMNVNDLVCVGARPLALVDYVAVRALEAGFLEDLARGIAAGAQEAGVSVPAGEIAQVSELLAEPPRGVGFDLVGSAVGVLHPDRILVGRNVEPGDVVVGLAASGLHSNGYTLARHVLLDEGKLDLDSDPADLGRTLGEELLEPTRIYVRTALDLLDQAPGIRAFVHVTGDGLLNLARVEAPVGFTIERLPGPPPIFGLIERTGGVSRAEMFTVYNMGVGFCVVASPDAADEVVRIAESHGHACTLLGHAVSDTDRTVTIPPEKLVGREGAFREDT
jgi:phosphoribosylformylglycinamidine cyclo-ligase